MYEVGIENASSDDISIKTNDIPETVDCELCINSNRNVDWLKAKDFKYNLYLTFIY